MKNDSKSRSAICVSLIRIGWIFIVAGMSYTIGGLIGLVPLELESGMLTNLRTPAGLAVLGCLICFLAYGKD